MTSSLQLRAFVEEDQAQVRSLFIKVNQLLAPPELTEAFETYIEQSLEQEIDRISSYYESHGGSFWVCLIDEKIVGMFGLEQYADTDLELRRMYVDPNARRMGIARKMLNFAEQQALHAGANHLYLSTSEIQDAALSLYKNAGYQLLREDISEGRSNKTIGGGIRRFYFSKALS